MKNFIKNLLLSLFVIFHLVMIFTLFMSFASQPQPQPERWSEPIYTSGSFSECWYESAFNEELRICERAQSKPFSLNYVGPELIVNSLDDSDIVLCPGDTFGDLNDTYVTVKNCYLAMYHQDKIIWSSQTHPAYRHLQEPQAVDKRICAFSFKRDGDIVLYKEFDDIPDPENPYIVGAEIWAFKTPTDQYKTELRVQGQQIQIVKTYKDGMQRLFYADVKSQEFQEDLGEPVKVADKFFIKNHQDDENNIILRRNEYIGDLNGTYLILQTNCELQLRNNNETIWSFTVSFNHEMMCVLKVQKEGEITISSSEFEFLKQSIIESIGYREVISSQITFEEDQPIIVQTLKNGSEQVFSSGPGRNNALELRKEPKQIAENMITMVDL